MNTHRWHKEVLQLCKNLGAWTYHVSKWGSVYIKFSHTSLGSLRIADHDGREKYRYKWNIITGLGNPYVENDRGIIRRYYPLAMIGVTEFVKDINTYAKPMSVLFN